MTSLKIEGRLKTAEYVANITRHYRTAIDEAWAGRPVSFTPRDVQEMQLSFSRGFSHGFLDGTNHKVLVRGDYAKKRGILLGEVESITRSGVRLSAAAPIKPGDGVVFDGDESTGRAEQGGRVYEVIRLTGAGSPASGARGNSVRNNPPAAMARLGWSSFGLGAAISTCSRSSRASGSGRRTIPS